MLGRDTRLNLSRATRGATADAGPIAAAESIAKCWVLPSTLLRLDESAEEGQVERQRSFDGGTARCERYGRWG